MKSETASCCSTYAAPRCGVHHLASCDCRPGDECHHGNSVQHPLPLLFPLAAVGAFALFALDDALAIFRCSDSLRHFVVLTGHGVLRCFYSSNEYNGIMTSIKSDSKIPSQRSRELIMLMVNELVDDLSPEGQTVETELKVDKIDRAICASLDIDYDTAPSAYSYD